MVLAQGGRATHQLSNRLPPLEKRAQLDDLTPPSCYPEGWSAAQ
jgi:hypothetical protein